MDISYEQAQTPMVAESLLEVLVPQRQAVVVGLSGDLGAGKTTLVQSIARTLGVTEHVVSPTFVVAKFYPVTTVQFDRLVHIDAYRIESAQELAALGWETLIGTPRTLIIIEWPEHIREALPENTQSFCIEHLGDMRRITSQ